MVVLAQSALKPEHCEKSCSLHKLKLGNVWRFLALGLLFHCVFILSIFDIYFRSPLVIGLPPTESVRPAPAKRVVLFVGDGLRADKCFEFDADGQPHAPFLREMARTKGVWGVSHTRVPTESRPGHVAMLAGFYEDVSAVTKGWKKNPVEFDHVLQRAKYGWAFGAPDIVELFPGERVQSFHYSEEMIDFAKEAKEMDRWSFDTLRETFELAKYNKEVDEKLRSDEMVMLVHLLGCDTNGHAFGPHSHEYVDNIRFVDAGVKRAVAMMEEFYDDKATAYIFTSDHGMSDAFVHGDGDPDNTRCPLIIWGAGVTGPIATDHDQSDDYTRPWQLGDVLRRDIKQADLAPLMATLVGIPIPTNSEGVTPVSFLSSNKEFQSRAALTNLWQISKTLAAKEAERADHEPLFRPFTTSSAELKTQLDKIDALISRGQYDEALNNIVSVRETVFSGLQYYQKYDWALLQSVVALGYVGWMVYSVLYLAKQSAVFPAMRRSYPLLGAFISLGVAAASFLHMKHAPGQYYSYFGFPIWFAYSIASDLYIYGSAPFADIIEVGKNMPMMALYIIGMELLVLSFFHRSILTLVMPALALGLVALIKAPKAVAGMVLWSAFIPVAIFPLINPIKHANPTLFFIGVAAILAFTFSLTYFKAMRVPYLRMAAIVLAAGLVYRADSLFAAKLGLPTVNQVAAWGLLAHSFLTPFLIVPVQDPFERLLGLFLTFAPGYILLSIAYPPFSYMTSLGMSRYSTCVLLPRFSTSYKPFDATMQFLGINLVASLLLAFFGTGNMASIASFTLPSVYRLITVFSPFLMAALLIAKLLVPIVILSAATGAILRLLAIPPVAVPLLVVATVDIMTLNFFFLVRDHGSWLEIGTSISHFIIASVFSVLALCYSYGYYVMGYAYYGAKFYNDFAEENLIDRTSGLTGGDGLPLSIEITGAASQRIKTLGGRDLRVAVDSGGCHGFQYRISIDSATPEDVIFERDGARVLVDEISLPLLTGSTIDYKSELIGSAFCVVGNPAADSGCGCGVSGAAVGWGVAAGIAAFFLVERLPMFRRDLFANIPLLGSRYTAYLPVAEEENEEDDEE
ncbi:hypothetical protein PSACC_02911 [Paramicrosporidium saccamoebae]|uniref:GPI ethanolamine phosphate transferase 1 n=1 Tax=Paramicrosporidium saccamoebae TaxID=1246581 RepID=A0A2H9THN9_9FUNG|nr:hypothetical protein PSACC_02911 [Paramicrosporidium saccamoebae]